MEEHLRMERKASDNEYYHRGFHKTLDLGLRYIGEHYGSDAVKEYLARFTETYYAPLLEQIRKEGLSPLYEYIKETYASEHALQDCQIELKGEKLVVEIKACPVLRFFSQSGYEPSVWFYETTNTVNKTIAERTGLVYSSGVYDPITGHDSYSFQTKGEEAL